VAEGQPRVPSGVLSPVVRRRRSRAPLRLFLLAVGAVALGAGAIAYSHRHGHHHHVATPPVRTPPAVEAHAKPPPQLLFAGPVARHTFRPPLQARAAVVVDRGSGRVLWSLHPHRRLPIASTAKIMTAVLAMQRLRRDAIVTVAPGVLRIPLVREGLRPREHVQAWKLFDGLLMYSGNDDAYALAIATAGSRRAFIALMNEEARRLGLRDTHFSTPSGVIDLDNYSSAWDLAGLTRVAMRNPRFRQVVRQRIVHVPWSAPTFEKVYVNKNPLLGTYRGADGVKTGWTTIAGHCLVASATRRGRSIVAVVLGDPNSYGDARRLLTYGFESG
jgi:serine-type D-Ala-D-Ala carboxypeptidase (penicillin-binding protein 5/6)